eukprot:1623958-Prymnesium_polylepis.1
MLTWQSCIVWTPRSMRWMCAHPRDCAHHRHTTPHAHILADRRRSAQRHTRAYGLPAGSTSSVDSGRGVPADRRRVRTCAPRERKGTAVSADVGVSAARCAAAWARRRTSCTIISRLRGLSGRICGGDDLVRTA